jgi:hypothetical protein
MSDELLDPDVFVRLSLAFRAIKVVQNHFVSGSWEFTVDIMPNSDLSISSTEICGAFAKIKYWVEEIVNGSIMFAHTNQWAVEQFFGSPENEPVANNIVLLPGPAADDLIAKVLHSKLQALSNNHLILGPIEVSSADGIGISIFYTGENSDLPNMEQWVGKRSFFDEPWWRRDDSSTLDVVPTDADNIDIKPQFAESLDFLVAQPRKKRRKKADVIRHNFRPNVINGGV